MEYSLIDSNTNLWAAGNVTACMGYSHMVPTPSTIIVSYYLCGSSQSMLQLCDTLLFQ
jgi:hypothetical protein